MKERSSAEKLFIQEIAQASEKLRLATKGVTIGSLIKTIRIQLGMSQNILAKRAGIPQSTVSRIEQDQSDANLGTLTKILSVISCDLVIAPSLKEPLELIRKKQARKTAEKRLRYLKGTMNLESQQPDPTFIKTLLEDEEKRLLQGPSYKLWEE
ncbi:MAG: helix-turn-helix domain-containing protein [Parachlamydiaceae bacterium]